MCTVAQGAWAATIDLSTVTASSWFPVSPQN